MYRNLFFTFLVGLALLSYAFAEDVVWKVFNHEWVGEIAVTDDAVYAQKGYQELFCFDKKLGTYQILKNPYPDTYFVSLIASENGMLYASSYSGGDFDYDYGYILQYDGIDWKKITKYGDIMSKLVVDHRNGIWAITRGQLQIGGFGIRIDINSGTIIGEINRKDIFDHIFIAGPVAWFLDSQIHSLPDSLWYLPLDTGAFHTRSTLYKLPSGGAWGGVPDSSGVMWFGYNAGTEWGLAKLDNGTWEKVGLTTQFKEITTVAVDKRGAVWATTSKGLARFDGKAWTIYTPSNSGLPDKNISDIEVDRDGVVWIGTAGGLVSFTYDKPTAVKEQTLAALRILANTPNPFNPSTTISFTIPATGQINLSVYDITGRKVRDLVSRSLDVGDHFAIWDGCDTQGKQVSSGVYIAKLVHKGHTASQKMLLVR